jgi:arginyl-tRNA synthetase
MQAVLDKPFDLIANIICQGLSEFGVNGPLPGVVEIGLDLIPPPGRNLGDFAFGCFKLSKLLKKKPNEIALGLELKLGQDTRISAKAAGPYLNIKLKTDHAYRLWAQDILSGDYFSTPILIGAPKTMIEYSQPNTHKELHVGHMRNACLGDALVKLKRFAGIEVISSTFPGDVGAHVAKCLWYLKYHNTDPIPESNRGEWLGKLYSKAYLKLEDEKGTPAEEVNRAQLTEILKQLENRSGEFFDLWVTTREWSIDLMKRVYQWINIEFDVWYWESEVDQASRKYVEELLAQGKLIRSEGAVGMDLSEDKLGFCMLLKSDGTGLYATKDLELAKRKFQDFQIERSIYVVDVRQALHFAQVFKVLEKLGFEQAKNCVHLQYNFVELPDGAMSSRKGNIVAITDLIQKMKSMIQDKYLAKYQGDWSPQEIELVSNQVSVGAIKYGMLRIDTTKKIVFDMEEWLKIDGESGPFIQYSAARIKSLIKKLSDSTLQQKADWSHLKQEAELNLISQGLYFRTVIKNAAVQEKPHLVTTYLYELAKAFNYFYHECSIANAETFEIKVARLELARVIGKLLEKGLEILGIPTPDRM